MTMEVTEKRLLVAGDIMLDRYWFGEVNRISPEAPVPVVRVGKKEDRLGGAANVAVNAAALGVKVALIGVVGDDEAASTIEDLLIKKQINAKLSHDPSISTIIKLRVIGRQQQLVRIDFEEPPSETVLQTKLTAFTSEVTNADLVILSDYAKGSLTNVRDMISVAREAGKPVLVDPKGTDFERYSGATILTPNKSELRQVIGDWRTEAELTEKAQNLRASLNLGGLLLTRSEEGMSLFTEDAILHIPAMAREVYDVSGAGDTVIATLAVMLMQGKSLPESVMIANRAGGIVVGKLGTATVSREELFASST